LSISSSGVGFPGGAHNKWAFAPHIQVKGSHRQIQQQSTTHLPDKMKPSKAMAARAMNYIHFVGCYLSGTFSLVKQIKKVKLTK
jgi:hypothetical protein